MKNRGVTDTLYLINLSLVWIYTFLSLILSILGPLIGILDYSFISIVCPLIWAEISVHTGFIIWKAKVENLSKWTGKNIAQNASMNINMDI